MPSQPASSFSVATPTTATAAATPVPTGKLAPSLAKIDATDIVSFAAVDAVRSLCSMACAPPDLYYRACQLIHVLFRRPKIARGEQVQVQDATRDDLVCCAAAALFATAKAMSFLNLMSTNDVVTMLHLCLFRRKTAKNNSAANKDAMTFGGISMTGGGAAPSTAGGGSAAAAGAGEEPSALLKTNLTQRVVRWEYVLLEASGFKVISPTPYPLAINLSRIVHAAIECGKEKALALCTPADDGVKRRWLVALESVPTYQRFLTTVVARLSDAARSAKLTTATPAEVVAAAAVCSTVMHMRGRVCFDILKNFVFAPSSSVCASSSSSGSSSSSSAAAVLLTERSFPFCRCLGKECSDDAICAAIEEMDRVSDPQGAASAPPAQLAQLWPEHEIALNIARKKAEAEQAALEKKRREEKESKERGRESKWKDGGDDDKTADDDTRRRHHHHHHHSEDDKKSKHDKKSKSDRHREGGRRRDRDD